MERDAVKFMKPLSKSILLALGAVALAQPGLIPTTFADEASYQFRIEPELYDGARGTEPLRQAIFQARLHWQGAASPTLFARGWELALHAESELQGRHDVSFDIDRAWIETRLGAKDTPSAPVVVWGRVHPWNLSGHPESLRPWGYLAQDQSQNRGIILGQTEEGETFPQPTIMGWLGVHFWSDASHRSDLEWGISATPFFIPSLGSEVALSETTDASAGRFGRRPPGFIEREGALFPLRYQIDQSRILQDIILQPQLMAQARFKNSWLSVSRAPAPDPTALTSGFLNVSSTGITAVAVVKPIFPEHWLASLSQEWLLDTQSPFRFKLFDSLQIRDDRQWGFEVGARSEYGSLSLANEPYSGAPQAGATSVTAGAYSEMLLQADAKLLLGVLKHPILVLGGIKTHLRQNDLWTRVQLQTGMGAHAGLDLGFDLFSGGDLSYFGEWRTNSRIFAAMRWQL